MSKVIETTPDYTLQIGLSNEVEGKSCYEIVNNIYGVIEAQCFILPQGYEYLEQLQAKLDARRDMLEEMKKATAEKPTMVAFPH